MSKRLAPFTVVITHSHGYPQNSPVPDYVKSAAQSLGRKMDIANPVMKAFLAGSFSGTCSTVLFQPLDLVKTRIQNQGSTATATAAAPTQQQIQRALRSPSMFSMARQVLATENVHGLWRGLLPSVTRTVPGVGIYFGTLHWLKTSSGQENPAPLQAVCLGITARSFAATVMIPITVLKARFESGRFNYTRMSTALVHIYRTEGLRGLTCGLLPTIVRDAPYSGLYLMFYTQLKQNVVPRLSNPTPFGGGSRNNANAVEEGAGGTAISHFACGIAAGFLASLVTHPADVVKTRMQVTPEVYRSIHQAVREIAMKSGPRGFLVGFAPRMLRRALMSALAWTLYEEIMRKIGLK